MSLDTPGTLYIVATPIGNLEDISARAERVLSEVDIIFAEDTRETGKLLSRFEINTALDRYDEHTHETQSLKILQALEEGKSVALVSDAGTPTISDPGYRLVRLVRESLPEASISPIPGPSAIITLLSASGLPSDSFVFLGFLPHKKGRKTIFDEIEQSKKTTVFYESPHRVSKSLQSLSDCLEEDRILVVGRELTKMHEEVYAGTSKKVLEYYESNPDKVRGEFVVAVEGKK